MDTGMYACADAHMHCCLSIKWVDQGVVFIHYPLSGLPLEPMCPDNPNPIFIICLQICVVMASLVVLVFMLQSMKVSACT